VAEKKGTERWPVALQAARWRGAEREKGRGAYGRSHMEEEEEGGHGVAVGIVGLPAMAPSRQAWAVALPREQGRGQVRVADTWVTSCDVHW
jgi:hypothetical protein